MNPRRAMFVVAALALSALCAAPGMAQAPADPGGESRDLGVAATSELRLDAHSGPTPTEIPGAKLVLTAELRAMLELPGAERPILFDVLGGAGHDSLPGAIWLADAGRGTSFEDETQERLSRTLAFLTRGTSGRKLIFFCASAYCWLSYNAALRAVKLGYADVGWYRGGIHSWTAAGGTVAPMRIGWKRNDAAK